MIVRIVGGLIVVVVVSTIVFEWTFTPASPDLPTFQQTELQLQGMAQVDQAEREGRVTEDRARAELRRKVLQTYKRLEQTPCAEDLRQDFVAAVIPFLEAVYETRNSAPIETFREDGEAMNATGYLDRKAMDTISMAGLYGLLSHKELPPHLLSIAGPMTSQFEDSAAVIAKVFPGPKCG